MLYTVCVYTKKKKIHIAVFDYGSIVLSFLIFMLAWLNSNLTDMPWYGSLLTITLSITAVLAIFSILNIHKHKRLAVVFGSVLLLLSIPSAMHRAYGSLSVPEIVVFYAKQVYMPLLAGIALFCLLREKGWLLWQALLRWGSRAYAVLGILLGTLIIYTELTQETPPEVTALAEQSSEIAAAFAVVTVIGIVLAIAGLIVNPLYVVWRNTKEGR